MTQLTTPHKPATAQPSEVPQPPEPKAPSHRWVWILIGSVAIAGIGVGIWYAFLHPQNTHLISFSGRIEGYETDVSTKGAGRVEAVTV